MISKHWPLSDISPYCHYPFTLLFTLSIPHMIVTIFPLLTAYGMLYVWHNLYLAAI